MCIALLVKPGAEITDDVLKTCYTNNSDGCGFAYVNEEGKVEVKKSMEFPEFLSDFRVAQESQGSSSPFLVHFRIATHGGINMFNCHPFLIDEETAFIHNGVIHKVRKDQKMSDTQVFNEDILKGLPEGWKFNMAIKPLIEEYIGYSKLVLLSSDKGWEIYNEAKGEWEGDIWFSNTSYKRAAWKPSAHKARKPTTVVPKVIPQQQNNELLMDIKTSWEPCNNCGDYHALSGMVAYEAFNSDQVFCKECETSLLISDYLDPADKISLAGYVEDYNRRILNNNYMSEGGNC